MDFFCPGERWNGLPNVFAFLTVIASPVEGINGDTLRGQTWGR